jgi:SPP1 family predicted phage head-tail adaptor
MRAGNLDRIVLIEQATTNVSDAGTPKKSWTTFATMRAQLLQFDTNDREASRGSATEQSVTFRMRWLDGVTLDHRVNYDGQAFTIKTIRELGRRAGLDLICERLGP